MAKTSKNIIFSQMNRPKLIKIDVAKPG